MKTRFYKLFMLIAAVGFVFQSCESDDDVANTSLSGEVPTQFNISFVDTNDGVSISEGESLSFIVDLDQGLPVETVLSLTVTSTDETTNEVSFTNDVTIPANTATHQFDIQFNEDTESLSQTYTFVLNAANSSSEVYLTSSDGTRTVTVSDPPIIVETTTGDLDITFTSVDDIDVFGVVGIASDDNIATSPLFDVSATFSNTEMVTLLEAEADGDFSIFVQNFDENYPVDYDVTFDFAGGEQEMYTGELNDAMFTSIGNSGQIVAFINKATNGATVTYTITRL